MGGGDRYKINEKTSAYPVWPKPSMHKLDAPLIYRQVNGDRMTRLNSTLDGIGPHKQINGIIYYYRLQAVMTLSI